MIAEIAKQCLGLMCRKHTTLLQKNDLVLISCKEERQQQVVWDLS